MSDQAAFTAEVYQNQYLPSGGQVVDAVITVTASGGDKVYDSTTSAKVTLTDHPLSGDSVSVSYANAAY